MARNIKTNKIIAQMPTGSSENPLEIRDSDGVVIYSISSSGTPSGGVTFPILAPDGSNSAPSYSFASDTNSGMFLVASDVLGLAVGGSTKFVFSSADLNVNAVSMNFLLDSTLALYSNSGANLARIKVDPAKAVSTLFQLPSTNGTSGQVLSTDGTGITSWVGSSSGANTTLSNLSTTSINASLLPSGNNTLNVGSSTLNWLEAFVTTVTGPAGLNLRSSNVSAGPSQTVYISSGSASASGNTGSLVMTSGNSTAANSGLVSITSGTAASTSGNISLTTGSASSRGRIILDGLQIQPKCSIVPDATNSYSVGSSSFKFNNMFSEAYTLSDASAISWGKIERDQTVPSGANAGIIVRAGDDNTIIKNLGLTTANSSSGVTATGTVYIQTGNKTVGTGNSGDIILQTGTATATRGTITLNSPTVTVQGELVPNNANDKSLGTSTLTWRNLHIKSGLLYFSGAVVGIVDGDTQTLPGGTVADVSLATIPTNKRIGIHTADSSSLTVNTGPIHLESGNQTGGSGTTASGLIQIKTGNKSNVNSDGGSTGAVSIITGNASGSTGGNSGNITLQTGTSTAGTRGYVKFDALVAVLPTGTADPSTSYPDGSSYYNTSTNKIMVLNGGTWRGITLT